MNYSKIFGFHRFIGFKSTFFARLVVRVINNARVFVQLGQELFVTRLQMDKNNPSFVIKHGMAMAQGPQATSQESYCGMRQQQGQICTQSSPITPQLLVAVIEASVEKRINDPLLLNGA